MGPAETNVRRGLATRPASVILDAPRNVPGCFSGLFNGALRRGHLTPNGGLFIGKAECEWEWRETWGALKDLGLIEWSLEEKPNHPDVGGTTTYLNWEVTDKGWAVREDDNAYFRQLMDAMTFDRNHEAAPTPQPKDNPNA